MQLDFRSSLATLATAFNTLASENKALREELDNLRASAQKKLPIRDISECSDFVVAPAFTDLDAQMAEPSTKSEKAPHFGAKGFRNGIRNSSCADLTQLIADLDPEGQGAWASSCLRADEVFEILSGNDNVVCTMDEAEELVMKFQHHCSAQEPVIREATKIQFVNMTSAERLQEVFGADELDRIMVLQDALGAQLTNELLVEEPSTVKQSITFRSINDLKVSRLREFWHVLVSNTSKQDVIESIGTCAVILNTIMLGFSTDVTPGWNGWDIISSIFAIVFLTELLAKIGIAGGFHEYYCSSHGEWRFFDTGVILIALVDFVILVITADGDAVDARAFTVVRIVRLVRLTRITRLGNISAFNELSYMIRGIKAGTSTLVWALLLLVIVCYAGAILLTQTIGRSSSDFFRPYAERHFSSVVLSMFTLFRCFTGDCAAYDGVPLSYILYEQYGQLSVVVYWLLIMVVTFGLFNVMIANFLQNSQRAARFNEAEQRRMLRKERKMVHEKTASLMKRILELYSDKDGGQSMTELEISRDAFRSLLKDREIHQWFDGMGCDDGLRETLFDKIDRDGNGMLTAQELVSGIVDLLRGRFDNMEKVTNMLRAIQTRLVEIDEALGRMAGCQQQHVGAEPQG